MIRQSIEPKKLFELSIISFAIVEAVNFLLSKLGLMDFIKGGWILFMFGIVILFTTLFNLSMNFMNLKVKEIILMVLTLLIVIILYWVLPLAVPQLFSSLGIDVSSSNSLREFFIGGLNSVAGIGTGIV